MQGTKFGYYAAIYNKNNAESKLDQSIQSCKQVERDPDATEESEGKEFIILFFEFPFFLSSFFFENISSLVSQLFFLFEL